MPFLNFRNNRKFFNNLNKGCALICASFFVFNACQNSPKAELNALKKSKLPNVERLNKTMNIWHKAAAEADSAMYFSLMTENTRFMGTDASENWTKQAFINFTMPHFNKGNGWDFKAFDRHWFYNSDSTVAWFDERLNTWMGECRGSGVVLLENNESKIAQYNLAVTIANEKIQDFIALGKE